jgi:hypothetical protein
MEFLHLCEYVDGRLNLMSLEQKVILFRDVLGFPIDLTYNKYKYYDTIWDETRMNDFMRISEHWLTVNEYDKLNYYFMNLSKK